MASSCIASKSSWDAASSASTTKVADDARTAILAEETLSAAAATSNITAQALLALNLASESDSVESILGADAFGVIHETINELGNRSATFLAGLTAAEQTPVADALARFDEANSELVAALGESSADRAETARTAQGIAYRNLVDRIVEIRDVHTADVMLASQGVGRAVEAVRFIVIFLVPLMMIVLYRRGSVRREARRRLEEDLEWQRELTRSQDEFIADLSHELRTPLTGIYGFALALEEISELNEEEHDLVTMIVGEAVELNRMVDDLLAVGRIVAGTLVLESVEIPLGPVVADTVDPFTARDISVTTDMDEVSVRADRNAVRHMLTNLLSNANKHGGDNITVSAFQEDDQVIIQVSDDGPGVDEDVQPLLFGRYLHGRGGALIRGSIGLGTAVASTYAEAFGGKIEYRRIDDRTVFEIRLPSPVEQRTEEPVPALA